MKEQALVKGRHGKFECGYGIGRVSVGEEREREKRFNAKGRHEQ